MHNSDLRASARRRSIRRRRTAVGALAAALLVAADARAGQPETIVGMASRATGTVTLLRDGVAIALRGSTSLAPGDRLETDDGRAELVIEPGGAVLHLDRATTLDLLAAPLVRLLRGRVRITGGGAPRVDTPVLTVSPVDRGEWVVAHTAARTDVEVVRGAVEVRTGDTRRIVGAGLAIAWAETDPAGLPAPVPFNTARWTEFDRWVDERRLTQLDRYAPRFIRTGPGPHHAPPPAATAAAVPGGAATEWPHPQAWAPVFPWLIGSPARVHPHRRHGRRQVDGHRRPPAATVTAALPDADPAAPPATPAAVGAVATTALPARAVGHPAPRSLPGLSPSRLITLPAGPSATPATATRVAPPVPADTSRPAGMPSTTPGVVRPGHGATATRAPARSSRAERVGSRSARRSGTAGAQPAR